MAHPQQREDFLLMGTNQLSMGFFIPVCLTVFHTIFLTIAFYLPMAEHRKSRHGGEECADSYVLVAISKLGIGGFFIRVVHEVYITLKDFRIKENGVFYGVTILLVVFIFQHVHESTVVNPVHPQGPDKVSFHHPECLGKQERIRQFLSDTVNYLPPEFLGKGGIEGLLAQSMVCPPGNIPTMPGNRIPEALDMFACQGHRGIEPDDGECSCNMKYLLYDGLSGFRIKEIYLCCIIPGH